MLKAIDANVIDPDTVTTSMFGMRPEVRDRRAAKAGAGARERRSASRPAPSASTAPARWPPESRRRPPPKKPASATPSRRAPARIRSSTGTAYKITAPDRPGAALGD